MGILSQRTPPKKRRERSIFGSIFNALMLVVLVEVLLLVASIYLMRVGPQLNQNAEDILAMQVETRSGYIQSQLNDAQELSSLTSRVNTLTQELLDSGAIDLATLDSSSDAAYPLLAAVTPKLISTLRSKSVTGIYLILNTHDLNERASGDRLPSVYLRDLDPDSPPPENNSDLMFERAPARLVQTQNIATDKAWKPAITYRSLGTGGLLYPAFQTAYDAETKLDATAYGHWTTSLYVVNGDDRQAIAYSLPLILPDGTVYGVVGVELLTSYLTEKMPYNELHTSNSGSYALCYSGTTLNADTLTLTAFPVMNSGGLDLSTALQLTRRDADCFRFSKNNISYIASLVPLEVYSRNAPFYGEHWCLVGIVPSSALFAFAQRVQQLLFLTVLLTLIAGFAASWLVSERMSKPVAQLSAEVAKAQNAAALPQLSTTGIAEVDQFASAISQLSSDMLASSTRFLRIMEMASVELAGYELRNDSVYVTDNFFRMLGVQTPDPLTPSSFRAALSAVAHSSLYRTTPIGSSIFTIAQPDGSVQYIVLRITRIVAQTPSEVGLLEDVTSAILEQQRIERERDYDILTGLYSRQAFNRVCADLFAHPDRLRCAALLMMDLDNLKHINDTYGHDWGDQYIRQTGQCFAANTPKGTVCSRLSGDEFLLLFLRVRLAGRHPQRVAHPERGPAGQLCHPAQRQDAEHQHFRRRGVVPGGRHRLQDLEEVRRLCDVSGQAVPQGPHRRLRHRRVPPGGVRRPDPARVRTVAAGGTGDLLFPAHLLGPQRAGRRLRGADAGEHAHHHLPLAGHDAGPRAGPAVRHRADHPVQIQRDLRAIAAEGSAPEWGLPLRQLHRQCQPDPRRCGQVSALFPRTAQVSGGGDHRTGGSGPGFSGTEAERAGLFRLLRAG